MLLAQNARNLGDLEGLGPLGTAKAGQNIVLFPRIISMAIGVMTVVAFIWFIFQLFIGAITWRGSGGETKKIQEAQKKITTSLIGLVIVISALLITRIIEYIFGIDILAIYDLIWNIWN